MTDEFDLFANSRPASPERPLAGLTVLVVEDSRYASEALRLLCLRSGARIRRADSLQAAHRHLATYRPGVIIVDVGLPDGSGLDLIAELARAPGGHAVIASSGDDGLAAAALAAGAHAFLAKPVLSLGDFQSAVLEALPGAPGPGPGQSGQERVQPDPVALRDDLVRVSRAMASATDGPTCDYLAQFVGGLARSAGDAEMERAAQGLAQARGAGDDWNEPAARLAHLVEDRLSRRRAI